MQLSFLKRSKPMIVWQSADLYLASSKIHGMGVFSKEAIKKGTLIETAPLIIGSAQDYALLSQTALHDYYFMLRDKKNPIAIGLGFASWYNHACPANATYFIHKKKMFMEIKAVKYILVGEEITINYHGVYNNNSTVEFIS